MPFWKDRLFWSLYPAHAAVSAAALYGVLAGVEWLVAVLSTPEGVARAERVVLAAFALLIGGVLAALTAQRVRESRAARDAAGAFAARHMRAGDTTHGGK